MGAWTPWLVVSWSSWGQIPLLSCWCLMVDQVVQALGGKGRSLRAGIPLKSHSPSSVAWRQFDAFWSSLTGKQQNLGVRSCGDNTTCQPGSKALSCNVQQQYRFHHRQEKLRGTYDSPVGNFDEPMAYGSRSMAHSDQNRLLKQVAKTGCSQMTGSPEDFWTSQ